MISLSTFRIYLIIRQTGGITLMFLFNCCQEFTTGLGYQLEKRNKVNQISFVTSLKTVNAAELYNDEYNIIKMKKSDYDQLYQEYKNSNKKFIDHQFPANQTSLGSIQGLENARWKRISEIIPNPVLFGSSIQPSQVIQGNLGDCYFLSALAALAENPERITSIFKDQSYNISGIYKVSIQIDGQIQEILVDDFVPVGQTGQPLFCQPNKNEFWVLILQKVWAKVNGGYSKIIYGTPTQVLRSFTFAPSEMIIVKNKNEEKEKLWNNLFHHCTEMYPICCTVSEEVAKNGLVAGHSYTLLSAALLQDTQGTHHKLMKLRDPWGKSGWQGFASEKDRSFWNKMVSNSDKKIFEKKLQTSNYGIFYMTFNDFCQNFKQIHYSSLIKNSNYISEPVFSDKKHGKLFQVQILKKGTYCFTIHQSQIDNLKQEQQRLQGICRSTLLLIRNIKSDFQFVQGILKYNEQNTNLTHTLEPGSYILFVKVDPTRSRRLLPSKIILSIYSPFYLSLQSSQKFKYPNLLQKTFLNHARHYKKNKYNNGFMWLSSKLFFHQGGYAYIAFGNESGSNKKFIIDFVEQQFTKMSFKMKGEFKGIGSKRLEILPGEQVIFLSRVRNEVIQSLKFPPHIGIKMEMIQPQ